MNLPNALTLSRIFIVPLLVVVLLTPVSENWLGVPRYLLGVSIFVAAALTDYFDGKLARSRKQVSKLGKLLDPIADKLLISAALISLVENHLAPAWAVVIIIGREFAVSGLRSIAAAEGWAIAASPMGKFKMFSQVVTIALLITSSVSGQPPVQTKAFPIFAFLLYRRDASPAMLVATIAASTLIILKHRANIERLIGGTENRLSFSGKKG